MTELCFVLAPGQNHFFVELVDALLDELAQLGVPATTSTTGFPAARDGLAYVLVPPHEYVTMAPDAAQPTSRELARTVCLCTEQPGTKFFDGNLAIARAGAGAVLDINADATRELQLLGVPAVHAPVGWTRRWAAAAPGGERDVDVLHLGIHTPRRAAAIARYGPALARHRTDLRLADPTWSNAAGGPGFAVDEDKWALLARTRVLLNLHSEPRAYFESLRVVQAIVNGALVVSEHSSGTTPLVPGEHFVSGRLETLGLLAERYLEDDDERARLAAEAERFVREETPLRRTAERLAEAAEAVARRPAAPAADDAPALRPAYAGEERPSDDVFPSLVPDEDASVVRAALKELRLDVLQLTREVRRLQLARERGEALPDDEVVAAGAAHADARPRISVITALYNHAAHIEAALGSIAATGRRDVELVVCDDGSTDGGGDVVRGWSERHPDVPLLLVAHPVNRGLGPARNTAIGHARGELAFVLDADNEVYPAALDQLVKALDAEPPDVAFAYPMLAMVEGGEPVGLRSALAWDARLLRRGNFVDAMALWRMDALRRLGRFTTDRRMHGWEDYDLWCRTAEAGLRGVQVPRVLAEYRVAAHSMLSLTDISWRIAVSLLIERYPRVMGAVQPPL